MFVASLSPLWQNKFALLTAAKTSKGFQNLGSLTGVPSMHPVQFQLGRQLVQLGGFHPIIFQVGLGHRLAGIQHGAEPQETADLVVLQQGGGI